MDKYIVNVQLADAIHQACKDCVRHAALKVRASSFQSHGYSGPLVQTSHSTECCECPGGLSELGLVVPCSEIQ